MSINLYGNIGTTYTGIVTGAELERVSQEIFGGAQVGASEKTSQPVQQTPAQQVSPSEINLYNRNTDINLTQQIAQTKSDFNVQLSPEALQNLEALRVLAAMQQANVHKLNEGKIYIPVDNSGKSDVETVFALPHATTVMNAFSMEKDRKGSNPFAYVYLSSNEEEGAEPSDSGATISFVA